MAEVRVKAADRIFLLWLLREVPDCALVVEKEQAEELVELVYVQTLAGATRSTI